MSQRVFCRFVASRTLVLSMVMLLFAPTVTQAGVIGFTGPFDVSNWTLTSDPSFGDGSVDTALAPVSVTIIGSDNHWASDFFETVNTDYTIVAADAFRVSFDWTYSCSDIELFDGFGYLRNGNFTELANNSLQGSGSTRFRVAQGDTFGFRVFAADNGYGPGFATISSFDAAPVPEPTSMAIFGFGALALAYRARRESKS